MTHLLESVLPEGEVWGGTVLSVVLAMSALSLLSKRRHSRELTYK